jgi:GAF domain-containing protein
MGNESHDEPRGLDSRGHLPPADPAWQFSHLARSLQAEPDLEQTLHSIVGAVVVNVDGADLAGITLSTKSGVVNTPAATDDLVREIDRVQSEVRQGPCLSSAWEGITVRSDDLATETKWPSFARRASDLGVRSMLSFQLYVQDEELGSLNLYSRTASGFDDVDEITGLLFASHGAVVLAGAQHESNLQAALAGLDIIGQAKGILMERYQLTEAAAFAVLVRTSQYSNRKLRDIAETLALTGILEMTTHTQSGDL